MQQPCVSTREPVPLGGSTPEPRVKCGPTLNPDLSTAPTVPPASEPTPTVTATEVQVEGSAASCVEDEPCWDCTTMGNQQCGPTLNPDPAVEAETAVVPAAPPMLPGLPDTGVDWWLLPLAAALVVTGRAVLRFAR